MKKKRLQQFTLLFSLFILLILPTAIVGYGNISTLVNKAFGKPFQKDESTFIVSTESSANISKGSQFSLKSTVTATKTLPLKHFAVYIEYDESYIDVRSINLQNPDQFVVVDHKNGFLIYPKTMITPTTYEDLLPQKCFDSSSCDFTTLNASSVSFSLNGILIEELTEQQRPIKMTFIGAAETESIFIWNEKVFLPSLKLGEYIKNEAPSFTSEPTIYTKTKSPYEYRITTEDSDQDPVILSLECPDSVFCEKDSSFPEGITIEDNVLRWANPIYNSKPYKITVFANDGKSVTSQSFLLYVLEEDTEYFSCTYTPAIAVKVLDFREVTPLVIIAESSDPILSVSASLERNGEIEKTFDYTFVEGQKKVFLDPSSKPALEYQFSKGEYEGKAIFKSVSGKEFTCVFDNPTETITSVVSKALKMTAQQIFSPVSAVSVDVNNVPVFLTDPYLPASSGGSSPSVSFVYGTAYTFTLNAQDYDGDPLQHTVVTKPGWANLTISSSTGTPSQYSIQVTGTPTESDAGSNLFSISINDGYGHYITKTWVINVDYPNNDIPRVYLTRTQDFALPSYCPATTNTPVTLHQGSSFIMVFDVEDRHQIVKFGLYFGKSLSTTSWSTYNANISYKMRCMAVNTANIAPGDYYFKLTATDGFSPPATGAAYTNLVRILPPKPKPTATPAPTATPLITTTVGPTPTPTVTPTISTTPVPKKILIQITSPQADAEVAPEDFQIVASIKASEDAEITEKDIIITLDEDDISDKVEFSTEKGSSITISYKPNTLLEAGVHSLIIKATDSEDKNAEEKRSFIIKVKVEDDSEYISFLGFDNIEKKWFALIIAGLILLGILIILPIILYFASRNKDTFTPTARPTYKPSSPPPPPNLQNRTSSFAAPTTNRQPIPQRATVRPPVPVAQPRPTPISAPIATSTMPPQPVQVSAPVREPVQQMQATPLETQPLRPVINDPMRNFVEQTRQQTAPIAVPVSKPVQNIPSQEHGTPQTSNLENKTPTPAIKKSDAPASIPASTKPQQSPKMPQQKMQNKPQIKNTGVPMPMTKRNTPDSASQPSNIPQMKDKSKIPPQSPSIPKK